MLKRQLVLSAIDHATNTSMPARILAAIYAGISTARPVICPAFSFA